MERRSKEGGFTLPGMNLQGFGNAKDGRSKSSAFQAATSKIGETMKKHRAWGRSELGNGTSGNPNLTKTENVSFAGTNPWRNRPAYGWGGGGGGFMGFGQRPRSRSIWSGGLFGSKLDPVGRHLIGRHKKFGVGSKYDPLGRALGLGGLFGGSSSKPTGLFGALSAVTGWGSRKRRANPYAHPAYRRAAIMARRRRASARSKAQSKATKAEMNV